MTVVLRETASIRHLDVCDAAALALAYVRNRDYLQPWEPVRPEKFYTPDGQRERLTVSVAEQAAGRSFFWALFDGADVIGCISLTDVVHGAFQNGHVGYWIARDYQARGLATAAVGFVRTFATELGLHRLQAATLADNPGSQRVLARNGFVEIGTAGSYLRINGRWQDHILFQGILHD